MVVRNDAGFGYRCPKPHPVCLSSTHVAYASIRMETICMIRGQSERSAAALAIKDQIAVQDLDYDMQAKRLEADKQILIDRNS